jgi:hypothetical protein
VLTAFCPARICPARICPARIYPARIYPAWIRPAGISTAGICPARIARSALGATLPGIKSGEPLVTARLDLPVGTIIGRRGRRKSASGLALLIEVARGWAIRDEAAKSSGGGQGARGLEVLRAWVGRAGGSACLRLHRLGWRGVRAREGGSLCRTRFAIWENTELGKESLGVDNRRHVFCCQVGGRGKLAGDLHRRAEATIGVRFIDGG